MDQAHRRGGPAVTSGSRERSVGCAGHSLNTVLGCVATSSTAVSRASSSSSWCSATSVASQPASTRRDRSWRAGIEQNARVSSTKPDVRENPTVSVTAARNRRDRVRGVEEPPGHADVDRRVEAGQRRELAGEHGLVEGEQHQVEARVRAVALQQRAQRVGELHPDRDVVARVRPEPFGRGTVVAAADARGAGSSPARRRTTSGPSRAAGAGATRWPRPPSRRRRAPSGRSARPPTAPTGRCGRRRGCGRPRRRRARRSTGGAPPAPARSRRSRRCRRRPPCRARPPRPPSRAARARDSGRGGTSG